MAMQGFVMIWERRHTHAGIARWHQTFESALSDAKRMWHDANPVYEEISILQLEMMGVVWTSKAMVR
jgi:hypothetical protein